jgi:minor fimbrial subunit
MSELIKRILLIFVAGMMSGAALATDLNITGTVVASPCTVDTSSVSQDVDFGQVRLTVMRVAGNASEWKPFEVKLINCPRATTSVTVTFSGMPDNDDATLYTNAGTAPHAAVQVAQQMNKSLVQGDGSTMTVPVNAQRNATYALAGRLIVNDDTGPGTFSSVVQMSFTYQ